MADRRVLKYESPAHQEVKPDISETLLELKRSLPFLPGHQFDIDKVEDPFDCAVFEHKQILPHHRKSQAFDYCNGVAVFKEEAPGIGGIPLTGQEEVKVHTSLEIYPHMDGVGISVPAWVLRFYAYFQEAVHEKREEQYRVRKVNIYFYLEDDTIHVSEPKTQNSGIPQGTLIRRHRIPKADSVKGQHYIVTDLNVEKEVTFYSRTFKIIGCDGFTRDFLGALGIETFLENDRRVLRFYCVWDDTNSVFGDVRHMVIHYYLSDDTIEIREAIPPNSGREHNTLFLRRCRLPKRFHSNSLGAHLNPNGETGDEFYTDRDLMIGSVLHLYGRPFVICDCDEFTKEYYRETYGLENFDPLRIEDYDVVEENRAQELMSFFPIAAEKANESSSLAIPSTTNNLPKKDFRKISQFDGVTLRYSATLKSMKRVDQDRKFVISLYPADDSITVFEPHQRNSGIIGGKFLEKQNIRKSDGTYFTVQDFYIGAEVEFYHHIFVLGGADDYAVKFMDQHPEMFPKHRPAAQ
ncbi:hypothetical protein BJ742DRAFT_747723 [Cladochytrium replicatum]|nr:hypothetical protein BJ742DRAFT_747723 [Cladochytrium replicatum]